MRPPASKYPLSALMIVSGAALAQATPLIENGGFESATNGAGEMDYNTDATGWSTNGYNFIFAPGTADTAGSVGEYGGLQLWGPGNGSSNGLPASSPDGGDFVAADGAFKVQPISQTINGLTAGDQYAVGFWWGGAQQSGFTGPTTEQWAVSLGNQSFDTSVVDNVSHGFTGWIHQTFNFTATSSSEMLSFLAVGTPTGVPPFALLDGVTAQQVTPQQVPEPAAWTVMAGGAAILAGVVWRRRQHPRT